MTGGRTAGPGARLLCLIDGTALAYRSYYAFIKRPLTNSRGEDVGAVYAFASSLMKLLEEVKPDHIAVVFDTPEPTFRHEAFTDYKANRPEMPDGLEMQLPRIKELVEAFGIAAVELPGYEADDCMGTLAIRALKLGIRTILLSSDKDFYQLVQDGISVLDPKRWVELGPAEVEERFGVSPEKVVEVLGLMGDASDNVPGVPGIGPKTAVNLIREFGSIEGVLSNLDQVSGAKRRSNLEAYADQAILSRDLVTIDVRAPVRTKIGALVAKAPDEGRVVRMLKELEMPSLLKRFLPGRDPCEVDYTLVTTKKALTELMAALGSSRGFAFDLETTSLDPLTAEIVGVAVSHTEKQARYIPVGHESGVGLDRDYVLESLRELLEDARVPKFGQNLKYDYEVLKLHGVEVRGMAFDTMLASYLLDAGRRRHNLASIALDFLDLMMTPIERLIGKGDSQRSFSEVSVDAARDYACEDADVTFRLTGLLGKKIHDEGLSGLMRDVELPLVRVLAKMELTGVALDVPFLETLSRRFGRDAAAIEEQIYERAGLSFNLDSPKQVSEVLFDKLGLPRARRTKTGYSTDVTVLESLKGAHEVPQLILSYRQLMKLKSGYVDALPRLVSARTGRVHTSFNQTVAATGRLSSSNPNLQNIPMRTEMGREIRKAFVAGEGRCLMSADYSQIELRVMAHLSGDENLRSAYVEGEDVHRRTAAMIFDVGEDDVTPVQRECAKTVNFGIMYGMSPFRLAREFDITTEEAAAFIEVYFETYPGVLAYADRAIEEARKTGYAKTILGRLRRIGGIDSENARVRGMAERAAVNTPIQGSAADLVKLAMIGISSRLEERALAADMVLQVHDELIFDVDEGALRDVEEIAIEEMECPGGIQLDVPLAVNISHGRSWFEAH